MSVYYRIAKRFKSVMGEGYIWYTPTLDQGLAQRYAFGLNLEKRFGPQPNFLVFAASSAERLDWMLEQYCKGREACYAEVQEFLVGRLDEGYVERWEYEHKGKIGGLNVRLEVVDDASEVLDEVAKVWDSSAFEEYIKEDSSWVQSIMRGVVERVFNQEAEKAPEPPATVEEEVEDSEPKSGPIKCPRLPKGGKRRAEFYKWMVESGRLGGIDDGVLEV